MIVSRDEMPEGKREIDLQGPEGNAFMLLGIAKHIAKQLCIDHKALQEKMKSGDYENLISVMDEALGDYIIMYK